MISTRQEAPGRWVAVGDDGVVAGELRVFVRPDGRRFALFGPSSDAVVGALLEAALAAVDGDLRVEAGADDAARLALLTGHGFAVDRREHVYAVPTRRLGVDVEPPDGFGLRSAADVDLERFRLLDEALRRDVPGVGEWRNEPAAFGRETFDDPQFDPATYLIAVDGSTGGYVGLVRVWVRTTGPRLGLIGVLPEYRGRGLARALVGAVLDVLHKRGEAEVVCEVDETNAASNALMAGFGARRIGGNIELSWRRRR
ncbi:GNAT family N-acetyltransferase [Jiangella asiatica]|uniref:GNAT family N-acetyltransferase n=1 Tax=Jiangella asiatica TaxID=2530372 RepID=A0A4R5CQV8_9ACTN|nr:GNAT family N-acetyltransferase [Jiangella asiatica]TDE00075.1 GNAT family N-acetyltransferase [Jiangella asiatica]